MRYTLTLILALCTLQLSAQKPGTKPAMRAAGAAKPAAKNATQKSGYTESNITTPSGMQIHLFSAGKGPGPKPGDFMSFHLIIRTGSDSILMSTYSQNSPNKGKPMEIQYTQSVSIMDLMEAFQRLSPGDSAAIKVPSDSIFKGNLAAEREKGERDAIAKFVKDSNLKVTVTASGLNYVILRPGTGDQAKPGDEVVVHYAGRLFNGKQFDASYSRGEPFTFKLGAGQVIKGWDEGVALLKVGEKIKLIIPSGMAYGAQGAGADIPPNSPLVFDVELISIKK